MKKNPKYKVCILAGGVGSRMLHYSNFIQKAVLPVNNKGVISHIIEKFPKNIEFVVAVGHKADTVVDYLKLAHPERKFKFITVKNFTGGPGYGILECKKELQCPFIFVAGDTIVSEDIPEPTYNWMGVAPVRETEPYCTVAIKDNLICQLDDKTKNSNHFAFIGLAGIKDYKDFFKALELNNKLIKGEIQVSSGFNALIEKRLVPVGFTWFDTGTIDNYKDTNKALSEESKFDFSKDNEFLYFVNGRVIKFFADPTITEKRHQRSQTGLKGITPKIEGRRGNFYSYKMIEGNTLYSVLNTKLAQEFLVWAKKNIWKQLKLNDKQKKQFQDAVVKFYKEKTQQRIDAYAKKGGKEADIINGIKVPKIKELLEQIDWEHLTSAEPSNFHGDLQFDNVLVKSKYKNLQDKFVLLDWRHDFGGLVHVGDLYYDLAKLYGGMIISYPLIKEGMFNSVINGNEANYHFFTKNDLHEAREHYEDFLRKNNYDIKKIKTITALIFLNMAPLHNEPFDHMLIHLGRSMLYKTLQMS